MGGMQWQVDTRPTSCACHMPLSTKALNSCHTPLAAMALAVEIALCPENEYQAQLHDTYAAVHSPGKLQLHQAGQLLQCWQDLFAAVTRVEAQALQPGQPFDCPC